MAYEDETEEDTRAERIEPVLRAAGWGVVEGSSIRREVICPGRIMTGGKRSSSLKCDFVLFYKGHKLATLEAKRAGLHYSEGIAQTKDYAGRLGARFAYSSNGLGWYQIDMKTATEGEIELPFPTPDDLWNRAFEAPNEWRERFGDVPFETDSGKWDPRYYQHNAITKTLEAIADGRDRILLTLATGTGKTSIAFQIAWKLFQSKWSLTRQPDRRPRILFLADRNILANQAFNAFSAFPSDAITRIDPETIRKNGRVPKNASIFFTIFQTFMTGDGDPVFHDYPPDFFDFIVIDECHRGGAKDESQWRGILEYFSPAVQLGLTATPKRTNNADTYDYFGEPVYEYSLRDGIEDGFLTPFKVNQIASTMDEYQWEEGDEVISGELDPEKIYGEAEMNRRIVVLERERSRVREFLSRTDPRQKTLIFCATQGHAALIRDLINQEPVSNDPNYCHRVTADDGTIGEQHLRDFQDNEKMVPTILTTSQKLSTGVDARNVRHIVLMRPVNSMIEFKQIIGRGTRTFDGKDYFTIWDFVKAHENFNDPTWDGPPLPPDDPRPPRTPPDGPPPEGPPGGPPPEPPEPPQEKVFVKLSDGREREIQYLRSTSYWGPDGKPISAQEFLERLFGDLRGLIVDEDALRTIWSDPENRERLLKQLEERGYDDEKLNDMRLLIGAKDSDLFDVFSYILFTLAPLTREQRSTAVKQTGLSDFADEMRELMVGILETYEIGGHKELSDEKLQQTLISQYGGVREAKLKLGEVAHIRSSYRTVQKRLYS